MAAGDRKWGAGDRKGPGRYFFIKSRAGKDRDRTGQAGKVGERPGLNRAGRERPG